MFAVFWRPSRSMNAFEAAERIGMADELYAELLDLFERENRGGANTVIPATYLRVIVDRK